MSSTSLETEYASIFDGEGSSGVAEDFLERYDGQKVQLPRNMPSGVAVRIINEVHKQTTFDRRFHCRPDDGGHATIQVLRRRYGSVKAMEELLEDRVIPPQSRNVVTGHNASVELPWGLLGVAGMPDLHIKICDRHSSRGSGSVLMLHVSAPAAMKNEVLEIYAEIEEHLREHSIYRGKALKGAHALDFIDPNAFDASEIILTEEALEQLELCLWGPIRQSEDLRAEGIPLKRNTCLYGPRGTGKSSVGLMTAKVCADNGWTYLAVDIANENLSDALAFARMYQPCLVFVEDVDVDSSSGEANDVREISDLFDGISTKNLEVATLLTTNHVDKIHKNMLRPGRIDALINIGKLDRNSSELMIRANIDAEKLGNDIDFDAVYDQLGEFLPAFVKEACIRAKLAAMIREGGRKYLLQTSDIIQAIDSLKGHFQQMEDAKEGIKPPALEEVVGKMLTGAFGNMMITYPGELSPRYDIRPRNGNHAGMS